ncbi:MAG TPA: DUF6279 family lipoprotein [Methylophilaceae bacterium]|nr:DUF6279 family lipoprotein [Methylophilaceae bacterium]
MNLKRFLQSLCIVLLFCLQGCSAINLTYNQAPPLIVWWLDDYFDLNPVQKSALKSELASLHAWHRSNELPLYAEMLDHLKTISAGDLRQDQVCAAVDQIRNRTKVFYVHAEPVMVSLAAGLTEQQFDTLQQRYAKKNKEWREEWVEGSAQDLEDYRVKRATQRLEAFYGGLTSQQEKILRSNIAASKFNPEISYVELLRRQQDTFQVLQSINANKNDPAKSGMLAHEYFERLASPPSPQYRKYVDMLTFYTCKTVAEIHNSASTKQRARLATKLEDYSNEFKRMKQQTNVTETAVNPNVLQQFH